MPKFGRKVPHLGCIVPGSVCVSEEGSNLALNIFLKCKGAVTGEAVVHW